VNTSTIRALADAHEKACDRLGILLYEAKFLKLSGHQEGVTLHVSIGGKSRLLSVVAVTRESGYSSVQVRGMEMIMLGVKKWYADAIDRERANVKKIEAQMREATQ
jgi:hypothetical protein